MLSAPWGRALCSSSSRQQVSWLSSRRWFERSAKMQIYSHSWDKFVTLTKGCKGIYRFLHKSRIWGRIGEWVSLSRKLDEGWGKDLKEKRKRSCVFFTVLMIAQSISDWIVPRNPLGACEDADFGAGGAWDSACLTSSQVIAPSPRTTLEKQGFLSISARYFSASEFFSKRDKVEMNFVSVCPSPCFCFLKCHFLMQIHEY